MSLFQCLRQAELKDHQGQDDQQTALLHRQIIDKKYIVRRVYADFYGRIIAALGTSSRPRRIVEIGTGSGFLKQHLPGLITSDILDLPFIDLRFSALQMPFRNDVLDAVVLVDAFHHLPDPKRFLSEIRRCLKPRGRLVMIEPANTAFNRFIHLHFHHENFDPRAGWEMDFKGPLSSANGALPWIVFERDRHEFEQLFPQLKLLDSQSHTPLSYLLAGGLSYRQFMPNCFYSIVRGMEKILAPLNRFLGMFVTITVVKREGTAELNGHAHEAQQSGD